MATLIRGIILAIAMIALSDFIYPHQPPQPEVTTDMVKSEGIALENFKRTIRKTSKLNEF